MIDIRMVPQSHFIIRSSTRKHYLKDHLEVEVHLNGKGIKNIDLHMIEGCIVMLAVAFARLQHGIKEDLFFSCISRIGAKPYIIEHINYLIIGGI